MAASSAVGADAMSALLGPAGAKVAAAAIALSIVGVANVILFANARVLFAMARDGHFLRSAGRIHPRFETPATALVWVAAIALAHVALSLVPAIGVESLTRYVVFSDWIFYGLTVASVFVLRRRLGPPSFRMPGYPVTAALFVGATALLLVATVAEAPKDALIGLGILGVGVVVYGGVRRRDY
jgi:APA family basic amino acid/polyamine antiporter